jgi:hypothetical protein
LVVSGKTPTTSPVAGLSDSKVLRDLLGDLPGDLVAIG